MGSSAEVANSTSTSTGNEAKNHGNVPVGNEIKSTEKIQGEKRSHDNSENSEIPSKISRKELNNLPTRQYLDATVVPILLEALAQVAKERPKEPIDYLITYLQNHKSEHNNQVTD